MTAAAQQSNAFRAVASAGAARALLLAGALLLAAGPTRAGVFNPEEFALGNGLQVVVVPNPAAAAVVQMLWYKVGAADEPPGRSGLAHMLEHLMFKATDRRPADAFSRLVASVGGRENAFTSQDATGYWQVVAPEHLEMVMELEAERMHRLVLREDEIERERQVVLEERRSRTDRSPAAVLAEAMRAALFRNHPYGTPTIGWRHEIEALSIDDLRAFYRRHYVPNNAVLVIGGNVDPGTVRTLAERHYGPLEPSADPPARIRPLEPPARVARRLVHRDPTVAEPSWRRFYPAPSHRLDPEGHVYALQVLAEALSGDATGRLHRRLVVEDGVAVSAGFAFSPDAYDHGTAALWAAPRTGTSVTALEEAVDAEIGRILSEGVDPEEVARAKRRLRASAVFARDSLQAGAHLLGEALVVAGVPVAEAEAWPERIDAVDAAAVNRAARALFRPESSVTGVLLGPREPKS